ncbi:MAG: SMI1/KNR4 family protein [Holosporales bacterium]|nr:SMI1/KNR4 family protein [Holosporales bacterium]
MDGLLRQNDSEDDYIYFEERLIPFGDTGGGDFICFDYRNHDGDNPPIILWTHDVYDNSKRISFIANNFEEFINMLHEPEN